MQHTPLIPTLPAQPSLPVQLEARGLSPQRSSQEPWQPGCSAPACVSTAGAFHQAEVLRAFSRPLRWFCFFVFFFLIPQACFFPAAYSLLVLTQRLVLTNLLYSLSTSFTKKTWGWVVVCWPLNVLLSPGVHSQPWASVSLDLPVPVRLCSSHWVQTGAEVSTSSCPCSPRSAVGDLTWPSLGAGGGRVRCVKGCTGQSAAG